MIKSTLSAPATIRVGLDEGGDGSVTVHAFTIPGCIASGESVETALASFEAELGRWLTFLHDIGETVPAGDVDIAVDEWVRGETAPDPLTAETLFEADVTPLTTAEVDAALAQLAALRRRLLPYIRRMRDQDLIERYRRGAEAIRILDELAHGHWWLLTRLGASPLAAIPDRIVERLDTAMALVVRTIAPFGSAKPPADLPSAIELDGVSWTPRKVVRYLLWLEWRLGSEALYALESGTGEEP